MSISADGVEQHRVEDLEPLVRQVDGRIVWVDIPICDAVAAGVLSEVFGFHPLAIKECVQRNRVPRMHVYPDYLFLVLHAPQRGQRGHIHYVELDLFVGHRYVVSVHGPLNPAVNPEVAFRETHGVRRRIESGRLRPSSGLELSHAIGGALTTTMEDLLEDLTESVWQLEQRVTAGETGDPETILEELFSTRHGLLAVANMAAHSQDVHSRVLVHAPLVPSDARPFLEDLVDKFERVHRSAQAQRDYLQGVIDHYRARTDTKMTIAAERLAVIAAVTLPVTALASVYGMNIIVNDRSDPAHLLLVVAVMSAMSAALLAWAKRHEWW
jgi:Mg2+ and Co2+ transporter CorA